MKRLLALVALVGVMAGCTQVRNASTATTSRHAGTIPGTLRIALPAEPKNLNPVLASDTTDGMIARLMFDVLLTADTKGNPLPSLAREVPTLENGGVSKDGLTVTYHLRSGVKWTDGQPLTSKDVKFTWQAVMNPNNNAVSRHGYDYVKSIDTPDDTTVVVHLKEKFSPFVNTFFAESDSPINIVPAHILSKYPNINQVPFNTEPVGSGPFKFAQWVRGDHITLVANKNYFMGAPKLDKIILRFVPDENTEVNLLRTHDIDWMFEASYSIYPAVHGIAGVSIPFNDINGYEGMQINTSRPMLADVRVRRAIAYAIDKRRLLDTLTFDQEKMATEDLPDWLWAYNPKVRTYPHDVNAAKQLLAQAGWKPGRDGVLTKGGSRLSLVLVLNVSNATRKAMAVQIQASLRQVGIEVQVKMFPTATLFAPAGEGGILQLGKYDLGLSGWFAGIDPDDSSNYLSTNVPPGGYNYTRYHSPAMDAAQNAALTHFDQPTRKRAYAQVESLLADDVPQIFFWWDRQMQPINPDFKNFTPNPVTESWNAWQWSI
ncbi:MAG TPA: peptide ABC transporter substrate-binding protein [Candidatus Baltobacteraceae bacterium]